MTIGTSDGEVYEDELDYVVKTSTKVPRKPFIREEEDLPLDMQGGEPSMLDELKSEERQQEFNLEWKGPGEELTNPEDWPMIKRPKERRAESKIPSIKDIPNDWTDILKREKGETDEQLLKRVPKNKEMFRWEQRPGYYIIRPIPESTEALTS